MQRYLTTAPAIWLIVSIAWILHGIAYADELVAFPAIAGQPMSWPVALGQAFLESVACWIVLSVALVEIVRRLPLAGPRRWRGLATLAGAIVAVIVVRAAYVRAIYPLLACYEAGVTPIPPFADILARSFRLHTVRVVLIAGVCYAWFHLQGTRANQSRIAELETGLAGARVDAASAQLNPGFLFNALDTIAARIRVDPDDADHLLIGLSSLLRGSLSDPAREIAVCEEAALTSQFFALERVRLGEPLELVLDVAPDCANALVPALILPPLAQFAMAFRRTPGVVHIAIRRHGNALAIDIGAAAGDATAAHGDLAIVAARLRRLYGERGTLTRQADGLRVALPLRRADTVAARSAA